jgi:hypothetical protein
LEILLEIPLVVYVGGSILPLKHPLAAEWYINNSQTNNLWLLAQLTSPHFSPCYTCQNTHWVVLMNVVVSNICQCHDHSNLRQFPLYEMWSTILWWLIHLVSIYKTPEMNIWKLIDSVGHRDHNSPPYGGLIDISTLVLQLLSSTPNYFLFVWYAWNFLQLSGSIVPPFYATRIPQMLLCQQVEWSTAYVEDICRGRQHWVSCSPRYHFSISSWSHS